MKKNIYLLLFLLIPLLTLTVNAKAEAASVRGVWISYVDFPDAGFYNKNEADFIKNSETVFKNLKKYGFNTVYFHVRPFDDAIYPNSSFNWCSHISDKPLNYDALKILINTAHKYNISFHAWINPYRITLDKIYNPAKASTTERIVSGVMEIIENYDVDGIHFDDYFYPAAKAGNQFCNVPQEERMSNVNNMIRSVYSAIKNYDPDIIFGISPSGNIEYSQSIGCDIDTWLTEDGYIDYIAPQIYWSDNYISGKKSRTLYSDTLEEWSDLGLGNIPVYPGLALYKSGINSGTDRGWKSTDNIVKQVKLSNFYDCNGYIMFSYKDLFTPAGKKELASYMKYFSSLKLKKTSLRIRKGRKYNISKIVSVKKKYSSYIKYSSSNKRIASVSERGVIRARKKGYARIYIKGIAGSKTGCLVRIY